MISCADVRAELVAMERGETPPELAQDVRRHVAGCAACAAERESVRLTLDALREHAQPELSADARLRLAGSLDAALAGSRRRRLLRRAAVLVSLPLAVAAGVFVAIRMSPDDDPATRGSTVAAVEADTLAPDAKGGVSRGLSWLAANQRADGTWAAEASSDAETTAAVTASALLAFAADGQSPHHGPNAAALQRADARLAALVYRGFPAQPDGKPLYAQALGTRALTAVWRLDREAMTPAERRERRWLLAEAGRRLVEWQNADGGFGYMSRPARSDASCTLFAAAALSDLRDAEILDPAGALVRAGGFLDPLRNGDGGLAYMRPGDRPSAPVLTAALTALDGKLDVAAAGPEAIAAVEKALGEGGDALLAWCGTEALVRRGRPLETPVRTLLASQRRDGAFPSAADARCAQGGDTLTTAFGVLALAQVTAR